MSTCKYTFTEQSYFIHLALVYFVCKTGLSQRSSIHASEAVLHSRTAHRLVALLTGLCSFVCLFTLVAPLPYTCRRIAAPQRSLWWHAFQSHHARSNHETESDVTVHDLGEFGVIARIAAGIPSRSEVHIGIGDDAAVLNWAPGYQLVVTGDSLVEGRHFAMDTFTAEQVGRRALAVNLSDIAAMGGEPMFALISLVLPPTLPIAWIDGLYAGLRAQARDFATAIVGGNVAGTSGPLVIDVTLIGRVPAGSAVLRSGANPGDRLCVTGTLGLAAAALLDMTGPPASPPPLSAAVARARAALLTPYPRVTAGQIIARARLATAMVDISDGMAADLAHLCESSHVGALVEAGALPIADDTIQIARAHGREALDLALHGGEDYELLFAVAPEGASAAVSALGDAGIPATPIGWLTPPEEGLRLRSADGALAPLPTGGWDHLRSAPTIISHNTTAADAPEGASSTSH